MIYIKLTKKQIYSKVVKIAKENVRLTKQYSDLSKSYENLLEEKIKSDNKLDDTLQVKESLQLQNQNLEKRLLATEVELLRKIVALYEKQQPQQAVYNYPSSNGVSTGTTNTFATTSSTMLGV